MNQIKWNKQAYRFLTAQTISLLGSSLTQYAIVWYITLQTQSGAMMTISTICGYTPQIIISLFAGVWLDRYDRKKMMMLSDGIIALSTLAIAVLFLAGINDIRLLFAVLLIRSAGTGIQTPAVNAFLPQIVPKDELMRINGINSALSSLTIFISPALSGIILTMTSIEAAFFVDVITAIIGIGMMFTIHGEKHVSSSTQTQWHELKQGFGYLNKNKVIKHQLLYTMVIAILISPSAFLTPLLISRSFGAEIWRLTAAQMLFSLGASIGGILIARFGGFRNRRHTIILATIGYGAMMIGMGISPVYTMFLMFNCFIGITMPCYNAPLTVLLQEQADSAMHGRVFSMLQVANALALPLGTAIYGPLADIVSVGAILFVNGLAVVAIALLFIKVKSS